MAHQKTYYYLIHLQYLGFRFHGWQKQPGVKTIESMIEKTLDFILGDTIYKILGSSRTDAMVSANHSAFMLFVNEPMERDQLKNDLNLNLPNDICITKIEQKDKSFNIINTPRIKEYLYLFAFGQKSHPFSASLMVTFPQLIDVEQMKKGALLFNGRHNFSQYCTKPTRKTNFDREILVCHIRENTAFQASFFPEKSWMLRIQAKGFLRYQIRLIMGQLLNLGMGKIELNDIEQSLLGKDTSPLRDIAPASGLILNKIIFPE